MRRVLAALVLVATAALALGVPLAVTPARAGLRVPAALITGEGLEDLHPHRGASRDRTLRGKARRRARQAARA